MKNKNLIIALVLLLAFALIAVVVALMTKTTSQRDDLNATWYLVQLDERDIVEFELPLTISDTEVTLKACNSFGYGDIEITDTQIKFHNEVISTLMFCEGGLGDLEVEIIGILNKPMGYELESETGILILTDDEHLLKFVREDKTSTYWENQN